MFFFYLPANHSDLHSFPTRRSSDLDPKFLREYLLAQYIINNTGELPSYYTAAQLWNRDRDELLARSEEHTSELQSHSDLVCRLLLEKKKRDAAVPDKHPSVDPACRW